MAVIKPLSTTRRVIRYALLVGLISTIAVIGLRVNAIFTTVAHLLARAV